MSDVPIIGLILLVTFALADFVRYFLRRYVSRLRHLYRAFDQHRNNRHQHEALSVLFEEHGEIVEHRICSHCGEVLS